MATGSMSRRRLLPERRFPPYAYLPGRQPHPVRDPAGHSYHGEPTALAAEAPLGADLFRWGIDLFNHGYYWEAHEAWETLWRAESQGTSRRLLFKGLILFAAAGVKIREGKQAAAGRHAKRAAALFRRVARAPDRLLEAALGASAAVLAEYAEAATTAPAASQAPMRAEPVSVFDCMLGPRSEIA